MSSEKDGKFTFTWKIKNISFCYQEIEQNLASPTFTVKALWKSKWYLNLFPRGDVGSENFVSCYLWRKNDGQKRKIRIDFTIELLTENGKKIKSFSTENKQIERGKSLGWDDFIEFDELINAMKNSSSDVLTVRCIMKNAQKNETICEASSTICVEHYSFDWTEDKNSIFTKIKKLEYLSLPFDISLKRCNKQIHISVVSFWVTSPLFVTLRICLLDVNRTQHHSKYDSHLFKSDGHEETWDFPNFLTTTLLNSKEFTRNGMFTLRCDLRVSRRVESESTLKYTDYTPESTPCTDNEEVYDYFSTSEFFPCADTSESFLHPNSVESQIFTGKLESSSCVDTVVVLLNFLRDVMKDKKHSDVKIKLDNKLFYAHRNILSARSPVFSAMFDKDMMETRTGEIDIKDINSETLEQFLEFVYTESLNIKNCDQALELLLVADKYQVQSLIEKCSLFLSTRLSNENVCEILVVADMIGNINLKTKLLDYIQVHANTILKSSDWSQWSEQNIKLANEIFSKLIERL